MSWTQHLLLFAVHCYRWTISPVLGALLGPTGGCRFTPTCSAYALEAVADYGAGEGSWMAFRRVCRCHPWGGSGHDPVPPRPLKSMSQNAPFPPERLAVSAAPESH